MVTPDESQPQLGEMPTEPTTTVPKEGHLSIRSDRETLERYTAIANYAVSEGVIPDNPRGNLTAWVLCCLQLGEEVMKQHACQARGYKGVTEHEIKRMLAFRAFIDTLDLSDFDKRKS